MTLKLPFTETWDLRNPEEKYDVIPEIFEGHNVADFIDPEIMQVNMFFNASALSIICCVLSDLTY